MIITYDDSGNYDDDNKIGSYNDNDYDTIINIAMTKTVILMSSNFSKCTPHSCW